MLLYDRNIFDSSSDIFGNLRTFSETIVWPLDNFYRIFGNLRKVFGNPQTIVKKVVISMFINKEFLFSCFNLISLLFSACTYEKSSWTLKEKFHIYEHPCIMLYMYLIVKHLWIDFLSCSEVVKNSSAHFIIQTTHRPKRVAVMAVGMIVSLNPAVALWNFYNLLLVV